MTHVPRQLCIELEADLARGERQGRTVTLKLKSAGFRVGNGQSSCHVAAHS